MSLSVRAYRYGYAVFEGDTPISGIGSLFATQRRRDEIAATRAKAAKVRRRKCLCCEAEVLSEGPHHRLCNHCRQRSA
jgi:hypothetical protein